MGAASFFMCLLGNNDKWINKLCLEETGSDRARGGTSERRGGVHPGPHSTHSLYTSFQLAPESTPDLSLSVTKMRSCQEKLGPTAIRPPASYPLKRKKKKIIKIKEQQWDVVEHEMDGGGSGL